MSLTYIAQRLNIYGGSVLLVAGIVGNGMNIFMFSSVRNYRRTPCTFYFLIGSIHNIFYIMIHLTIRIISASYGLDLTRYSLVWCKIQTFSVEYLGLTSFTCSCLASVDQFFATSRNARLRAYNKIELAHRLVILTTIIWCLHGVPTLVHLEIPPATTRCASVNAAYSYYISLYVLIFQCAVPNFVMILFGSLTYRNIRLTRFLAEQHADRQLVKMILIQVILVVISMTPVGCLLAYNLVTSNTSKDINRLQNESFALTIFILLSYSYYVGNFYMFLLSSSRFRRIVKERLLWVLRHNRIVPFH